MCGITGFLGDGKTEERQMILKRMCDKIIKRGPDDVGYFVGDGVALGMRRLSIIGVDNGKQPIWNEDRTLALVYNGEVYNYQELKEELIAKGHIFVTDTDSEVLIHGYEEYGVELLQKLRGMFGFAIWDTVKKRLFLARDMFGIKPMFYSKQGSELIFGSEIKSILEHPSVTKEFQEKVLPGYLSFQFNPNEESFFKGVNQLLPAHYLIWEDGEIEIHKYWNIEFNFKEDMTEEEATEKLEKVMLDSVEKHKIADVEMGSFLSGGIDSSFLAATSTLDKTYSVGFEWDACNETELAQELCDKLGMHNKKKIITTDEYWEGVPKVLRALDEPVADPSIIPLYYLCELAAKDVKVVISGEGSDELFGGYNIYQTPITLEPMSKIPMGIRKGVKNLMQKLPVSFKGKEYMIRAGQTIEERFIGNAYVFHADEVQDLLKGDQTNVKTPQEITAPFYEAVKDMDDITKMQYIDMNFWLRGDILRKSDHISMAHSLEVRVPYLDRCVAEAAFTIPTRLRVTPQDTKHSFRKMAHKFLPPETANRKKLGFPVPMKRWLREDEYYNVVYKKFTGKTAARYFHRKKLVELLETHKKGKKDLSRKIWTVYMFLLWYDMNFEDQAAR